jgi:hypothetical protein
MHDAMRQRRGLAGAGAGNDEKRGGLRKGQPTVLDGAALLRIELVEARRQHRSRIIRERGFTESRSRFVRNRRKFVDARP